MSTPSEHLQRWRDAGLIDQATASRIADYEDSREHPELAGDRPGVAEAVVYLAAAVMLVGVFVLASVSWSDFSAPVRIAITSISALAVLIAGAVMWAMGEPRMRRGASVTWLAGSALGAAAVAVAAYEAGVRDENIALFAAVTLLALSAVLAAVSQRHPQLVSLAAGVLFLAVAVAARLDNDASQPALGLIAGAFGSAGIFLAERNLLRPRSSGRVLSALVVVVGGAVFGLPSTHPVFELFALAGGGALVALSFWRRTLVYMGFGIAAIFIAMVTAVLRHIDDPSLAAVALIAAGLLLLGGVILVARLRSHVSAPTAAA